MRYFLISLLNSKVSVECPNIYFDRNRKSPRQLPFFTAKIFWNYQNMLHSFSVAQVFYFMQLNKEMVKWHWYKIISHCFHCSNHCHSFKVLFQIKDVHKHREWCHYAVTQLQPLRNIWDFVNIIKEHLMSY